MPVDAEAWKNEMIEKGYMPDDNGLYHIRKCNNGTALQQLFCKHRNDRLIKITWLYEGSDEAEQHGGKCHKYMCMDCGKTVYKREPISCDHCMGLISYHKCNGRMLKKDKKGNYLCWYAVR